MIARIYYNIYIIYIIIFLARKRKEKRYCIKQKHSISSTVKRWSTTKVLKCPNNFVHVRKCRFKTTRNTKSIWKHASELAI